MKAGDKIGIPQYEWGYSNGQSAEIFALTDEFCFKCGHKTVFGCADREDYDAGEWRACSSCGWKWHFGDQADMQGETFNPRMPDYFPDRYLLGKLREAINTIEGETSEPSSSLKVVS